MAYLESYQPSWRPSGQRTIDPGTTDLRKVWDPRGKLATFDLPNEKRTTNQRATQSITNHWTRIRDSVGDPEQPKPDVNRSSEYAKNKYRSYHDSVKIGQAERAKSVPPGTTFSHGTQYLEDDFEQRRTRGIAGYTGKQPLPHQKRPEKVEEVLDPSKLYGRGGSCQRKPWSKGIPGYTGHQPIQEYLHPGSELERHGVYLSIDPNIQGADYNLCPERDFDDDRSTSSPISNHSASSQKVFKNNLVVSNAPEDIARRKMEEALQYGDPQVDHEGSVATLRLSVKYHKAPGRRETTFPKQPVDRPKPGPMAEGKGAWRHTRTERSPPKGAQCDFDW